MFFFAERQDLLLGSSVNVNITSAGFYNSNASLTTGSVAAGTAVDSYYLHADPVGSASTLFTYNGSVTFNTDILVVIVLERQLGDSNGVLGHPGTLYSSTGQGLELGGPDTVTLTVSGRTLDFHLGTNTAADDIRIITAATVPEPAAWTLLLTCLGLCFAAIRKHQAHAGNQ